MSGMTPQMPWPFCCWPAASKFPELGPQGPSLLPAPSSSRPHRIAARLGRDRCVGRPEPESPSLNPPPRPRTRQYCPRPGLPQDGCLLPAAPPRPFIIAPPAALSINQPRQHNNNNRNDNSIIALHPLPTLPRDRRPHLPPPSSRARPVALFARQATLCRLSRIGPLANSHTSAA